MPPPKKRRAKLGIAVMLGAVIFVAVAGLGAYFFWWRAVTPQLARYAPKDTDYYIEVPSLPRLLLSIRNADGIDAKELDIERQRKDLTEAFADSFGIKDEEADDILVGLRSVAFAARTSDKGTFDRPQFMFMAKVSSADVLAPLLKSKRFDRKGSFAGGTRYRLTSRAAPPKEKPAEEGKGEDGRSAFLRVFDELGEDPPDESRPSIEDLDSEGRAPRRPRDKVYVYFEDPGLFVYGDPEMVEDVGRILDGDKESLADNPRFKQVSWPGGSTVIEFFEPDAVPQIRADVFDDVPAIATALRFERAGMVSEAQIELRGRRVEGLEPVIPKSVTLDLYKKLPADTFAYLAGSLKTEADGEELVSSFVGAVESVDRGAGRSLRRSLGQMSTELGFDLATVFEAAGDQYVIAATAEDEAMNDVVSRGSESGWFSRMSLCAVVEIGDAEAAEKIVKRLRKKAEEIADAAGLVVKKVDGGFRIDASDSKSRFIPFETLELAVRDKHIVFAAGAKKRVNVDEDAFDGAGELLKDDRGHARALDVLGERGQARLWFDMGRLARTYLKATREQKPREKMRKLGIPVDAFILDGDDRLTAGVSLRLEATDRGVKGKLVGLNNPLMLGLQGAVWGMRMKAADDTVRAVLEAEEREKRRETRVDPLPPPPKPPSPAPPPTSPPPTLPGDVPSVGIKACDEYLALLIKCGDKMGGSGPATMRESAKSVADAWRDALKTSPSIRDMIEKTCADSVASMGPACN